MKHGYSIYGRVLIGMICWLALASLPLAFADAPVLPKKVVTIEGITEYRLDNGLRILLFPDPSSSTVTVNCTVLVGSRHEGYGETGMAHLLEHMVFKGTPTFRDIPKALRDHGAKFNGTTWVDRTNYFETLPATDANLEFGLHLEADRLVNSLIKREDLLSEMTVVRNEFEMGENNPDYILSQRMMAVAYEWHNYGKSTIGNRSDIERVPIERLQAFYRKYYQPDNAVLVVAGKFDEKKALDYIARYFGPLKKPTRKLDTTYTEEPAQDGERTVVLRRVGKVGIVGLMYHIPAGAHPDFAALEVLNNMLVAEPSGRLYQALVGSRKANRVSGTAYSWHDPGILAISAEVDARKSLDAARDTMIEMVEGLGQAKLGDEEVARARRKLLKDRELLMANSSRVAITLSEWASKGDWRLFFLHRDRLEKVTPADVSRVAAQYLIKSNRTVGMYIPSQEAQRAKIPATPAVAALVKDYKGKAAVAAGEAFDPTPENIEKRVQRPTTPTGLKVALLPKKSRGEAVVVDLTLRFGNEESLKGQTSAAQFLGPLMARGTRTRDRQQIQDEFDKLGARLSASSSTGQVNFSIECKRETLPKVLLVLGDILRTPTFPEKEFHVLMAQYRDSLEKSSTDPHALAMRALQRKLSPYPETDVRYVPTIDEAIGRLKAVTLEQVRKLHAGQLSGQHGELVIVGDFDPQTASEWLQKTLHDWKAAVPYKRIPRPAQTDVASGRSIIETPDKANAVYVAGHTLAMTDTDPDHAALKITDFILGGGSLSSRLGNRVREKEGLSYAVQSHFRADSLDKSAQFLLFAICNPAVIDKVDSVIAEEVDKLLKEGVSAKELDEAKKAYLEEQKVRRSSDQQLAGLLSDALHAGRTFAYHADLEKKVAALQPAEVNAAIRKHISPKRLVLIRAGDFKGKGKQ